MVDECKLPKVSMVIAYYKKAKEVEECIESLIKTRYPDFEIILIDNASNDGVANSLQKISND